METLALADVVVAGYEKEAALYRRFLAVAQAIEKRLVAGEVERAQGLLAEQAELTSAIDQCNEAIEPLRRQLAACYGHPDLSMGLLSTLSQAPPPLARAGEAMRQVAELIKHLAAAFDRNQRLLRERLGAVRSEQAALTRGRSAVEAYRAIAPTDPRFVDRRS